MNEKKNKLEEKIVFIGIIILVAWVASTLVFSQVKQRNSLFEEARFSVAQQWGESQIIKGPIVAYPYTETVTVDDTSVIREKTGYILPNQLNISGEIIPEKRTRGIYDSVVYTTNLDINGDFVLDQNILNNLPSTARLQDSRLFVSINDTRGIKEQFALIWNEHVVPFEPSTNNYLFESYEGISAPISFDKRVGTYTYAFPLTLQGIQELEFAPVGASTKVSLDSTWQTPGFIGSFLPEDKVINENGFNSSWTISSFGRSYPQQWLGTTVNYQDIINSSFGVELFDSINFYEKITRAAKYAIMFIVLTLLAFFLFEIFTKLRIHPLQYLLIGVSLVLFYLLLLSLSEHLGFLPAYIIASVGTVLMVSLYSLNLLKKKSDALVIGAMLSALYAYLYILLQLQNFSLLIGSIFLFIILGTVMYLTRKINWYSIE